MTPRRQGGRIVMVHELDFWERVEDAKRMLAAFLHEFTTIGGNRAVSLPATMTCRVEPWPSCTS